MIQCKICPGRVFTSMYAYNQHAQTSKAHCKQYPCTICFQIFPSSFARNGHLAKNHQDLLCRQCNRYYLSQEALQQHYRSDPNHPSCGKCDVAFPDKATLSHHVRVVHPAPLCEFVCHPCEVAFEDQTQLFEHYKSSGAHPLCLVCDQGLEDLFKFDEHIKIYHPELFCVICGVGCQSGDQLRKHYRTADDLLHPTCDFCGEGIVDVAALKEHISVAHDISPIESVSSVDSDSYCLKCDVAFSHLFDLRGHYKDSPFHPTCMPCGEGFLDDVAYKNHLQDLHSQPLTRQSSRGTSSPVLSPPRSLRSLVTSPRSRNLNSPTSRTASPFPRTSSPTFFTSRSSRSTRSNSPTVSASPQTESETEVDIATHPQQTTQESGIEIASVSPRPSSAPSPATQFVIPTITVPDGLEPPPATPITSIAPTARETRLKPELRIPEPLCTVELMTPSVLGDDSPTYESQASTPEVLQTPSSLDSYDSEINESPTSAQNDFAAAQSPVFIIRRSPESSVVPLQASEPRFAQTPMRSPSRASVSTMTTAKEATEHAYTPSRMSTPAITDSVRSSPGVTRLSLGPTAFEPDTEMYRTEDCIRNPHDKLQEALAKDQVATETAAPSSSTVSSECDVPKKPPTYTTRSDSTSHDSECTGTRESSMDTRTKVSSTQASWHCRLCMNEPHDPTVTICGHLFCHGCIVAELAKNFQCPVCKKMMLVRLHVD